MLVSDIWKDAKGSRGYGNCNDDELYAAISQAVRTLSDKSQWDWMIGDMTICAYDGYLTLPREVEVVLAANSDGFPMWARDKWYVHHINGTGDHSLINGYNAFYDEVGETSTFRCMPEPSMLLGIPELDADNGKEMLVYGYDWTDKELYHTDSNGNTVKGIRVGITTESPPTYPDPVVVKKVTRVVKPETKGTVALWAFPQCWDDDSEATQIGFYYPDETTPRYRKYRFPKGSCVHIKYRRKTLDVTNQNDFIPFDNSLALLLQLKAIRKYYEGNLGDGQNFENKALQLLRETESARKAKNSIGPQIKDFSSNNNERLRGYGSRSIQGCWC